MLGFILFLTQLEKEPETEWADPSRIGALSYAWAEGGWPMYAVLAAAMVLALVTALFVLFAARGSAVLAVMHAHPDDRAPILMGSAKEALQSTTFGACLSAGACASLALALLPPVAPSPRRRRRLTARR